MTEEAGRENLGIVGHKEIVSWKQVGQIVDMMMGNSTLNPIDEHETGVITRFCLGLGDQVAWEMVLKIAQFHVDSIAYFNLVRSCVKLEQ